MADGKDQDFLNFAADTVNKEKSSTSSPYRIGRKGTKTVRIPADLYDVVRRIDFEENRSMLDVLNQLIRIGLKDDQFKDYRKYLE
ncbi:hypothetical protein QUW44_07895 [Limosilactobacillus pontis]|uniref:Uncharacterized protein n=1 Tax=Limosilactobacillus pontis TaxID=35787 RepID=A0ABT7V1A8_9LACO|nr:hypothetical protein [Limosilactobacillus pontis]MDM8267065.1 hypothetical protein [Limosilactobacillus pontis]